jgi:hypothetical protein
LATYRYYDKKTIGLDFSGMMEDIKKVGLFSLCNRSLLTL